jgi:hypothetical protein
MCRSVVIAMLFLSFQLPALGQRGSKHGASGTNGGTASQPEDPDVAGFKHAVAEQATDEQIGQFRLMAKNTEAARQQAQDFQDMGSKPGNSENLTSKATALQNSVEQALSDTRNFRRSFTDSQEATLKNQAKKLTKSDAALSKRAKAIGQQLERQTPNSSRLVSAAANLEKEIVVLQSDQIDLGKQMGIPAH